MKKLFKLIKALGLAFFALLMFSGAPVKAQEPGLFMEITKVKSLNDDFKGVEQELMAPYVQERIKDGTQLAHAIFRVRYPSSDDASYDYVIMDLYSTFDHIYQSREQMMKTVTTVFPYADVPVMIERFEAAIHESSTEVFVLRDEAIPGSEGGAGIPKFIRVNSMKVAEANMGAYASMESEVYKPLHKASIDAGELYDWLLVQRIMPFGTEWDNTFMTLDIYSEWSDMATNSGRFFEEVHPGKDPEALWQDMAALRELRRAELWELVSIVDTPTPEVGYNMTKEGTGPTAIPGQEVSWNGKMLNPAGEVLFATADLGFNFYTTIGGNPYDRFFEKGLEQLKVGGVLEITVPVEAQDDQVRQMSGGQTATMVIEAVGIANVGPNGTALLQEEIAKNGLGAAKAKYEELSAGKAMEYTFREGPMNALGYELIGADELETAIYIMDLNQKNHPNSWNAQDSLGDAYRAAGNYAKAKACYEKAIAINPNFEAAKAKLASL